MYVIHEHRLTLQHNQKKTLQLLCELFAQFLCLYFPSVFHFSVDYTTNERIIFFPNISLIFVQNPKSDNRTISQQFFCCLNFYCALYSLYLYVEVFAHVPESIEIDRIFLNWEQI